MDGNDVALAVAPCTSLMEQNPVGSPQLIKEGTQLCPLCSSEVKLYYVNFNEKILMCEKVECEFPFGNNELKFVNWQEGLDSVKLHLQLREKTKRSRSSAKSVRSIKSAASSVSSTAHSSTSGWSDVEKMCNVLELEDNSVKASTSKTRSKKTISIIEDEDQILKKVEQIKKITNILYIKRRPNTVISNKKWLSNLQSLDGKNSRRLIKPEELTYLDNKETRKDELKIDIDQNNVSPIKIEINCLPEPNNTQV